MSFIEPVARFPANTRGRDLIVGDIHGCFDALRMELHRVGFDATADRLFSVGDLVDRGPSCAEAIEWIALPWFFAVRGNHEQMAIGVAGGHHDHDHYRRNGGAWFLDLPSSRRDLVASVLDTLPIAIEIDHPAGRVGIVHAAVPDGDWDAFTAALSAPQSNNRRKQLLSTALWSRERIEDDDTSPVAGVNVVFVGHVPVASAGVMGNVAYIDTGAIFGGELTVTNIAHWLPPAGQPQPTAWRERVREAAARSTAA